jgi:hypothetical protein
MDSPVRETAHDAASPSTPRAQAQNYLYPAASQPVPMQLDPATTSNGYGVDSDTLEESPDADHQITETDSRKEVWKKRKQV